MLYSKFGFMYTDIKLNGEDYILIREEDVIGIMPRTSEWTCGIDSVRAAAGQTRALQAKGFLVGFRAGTLAPGGGGSAGEGQGNGVQQGEQGLVYMTLCCTRPRMGMEQQGQQEGGATPMQGLGERKGRGVSRVSRSWCT